MDDLTKISIGATVLVSNLAGLAEPIGTPIPLKQLSIEVLADLAAYFETKRCMASGIQLQRLVRKGQIDCDLKMGEILLILNEY